MSEGGGRVGPVPRPSAIVCRKERVRRVRG